MSIHLRLRNKKLVSTDDAKNYGKSSLSFLVLLNEKLNIWCVSELNHQMFLVPQNFILDFQEIQADISYLKLLVI